MSNSLEATKPNWWITRLVLVMIIAVTVFVYADVTNLKFTNWDDQGYVRDNLLVHDLSWSNIKTVFNPNTSVIGNYHPLTMLSFMIEYNFAELDAEIYHRDNLILHIINTILLFILIMMITRKIAIAFIVTLLFAIHPMHIESVAWISERKGLLQATFYLSALIFYMLYLRRNKSESETGESDLFNRYYVLAFIAMFLALMSKAIAVSIPIVFILFDYFYGRKIKFALFLEKLPFFFLAILFGVWAIISQQSVQSINVVEGYSIVDRFFIISYSVFAYMYKALWPVNLSAIYPYPVKTGGSLQMIFYISPVVLALITFVIYKSAKHTKTIVFSFLFFLISIIVLLQILSVGGAMMADRYTYLPFIGFFLLAGFAFDYFTDKNTGMKFLTDKLGYRTGKIIAPVLMVGFLAYAGYLGSLTKDRVGIWKDGMSLWTSIIDSHPNFHIPYNNRGHLYYQQAVGSSANGLLYEKTGNEVAAEKQKIITLALLDSSLLDYERALVVLPDYAGALYNRALLNQFKGLTDLAIIDYSKAIDADSTFASAYYNRGTTYYENGKTEFALKDFSKAIELDSTNEDAFYNRGMILFEDSFYIAALNDFTKAIDIDPYFVDAYNNRGTIRFINKQYIQAIADFNVIISIQPRFLLAYFNRGLSNYRLGNYDDAIIDFNNVLKLEPTYGKSYFQLSYAKYANGDVKGALEDAYKAYQLGIVLDEEFLKILQDENQVEEVPQDANQIDLIQEDSPDDSIK
ncbi:MAG: tetratricopeptide repeat protein [Bacteroidetes bacterium]|nr:tetratricopeptide repeat protein [Bacteroidota bacterium]